MDDNYGYPHDLGNLHIHVVPSHAMCSNTYFQGYRKECFEGLACLQGQWPYDGLTFPDFSHCVMSNFEIHWKMHLVRTCWNQSLKMHLTYQHQCGCSRSSDWLQPLWNLTGHVSDPPIQRFLVVETIASIARIVHLISHMLHIWNIYQHLPQK